MIRSPRPEHASAPFGAASASTRAQPQLRGLHPGSVSGLVASACAGTTCRYTHPRKADRYVIVTKQRTSGRQTVAQVSFHVPLSTALLSRSLSLALSPSARVSLSPWSLDFPPHCAYRSPFTGHRSDLSSLPSLFLFLSPPCLSPCAFFSLCVGKRTERAPVSSGKLEASRRD